MSKSPYAFRTTSEVAEELDLPPHVLRFWESKFAELKPLKRGGGRRYYRPEDVALLRQIRELLYREGYTIRGVQKLLRAAPSGEKRPIGEGSAAPLAEDRGERARERASAAAPRLRAAVEEVRGELLAIRILINRVLKDEN